MMGTSPLTPFLVWGRGYLGHYERHIVDLVLSMHLCSKADLECFDYVAVVGGLR